MARPLGRKLDNELVIVGVRPDPEPLYAALNIVAQGPVMDTDACRPEFSNTLEVQRRMMRVGLEQFEVSVGNDTNLPRESLVEGPKSRRGEVPHISRDPPDLNSTCDASRNLSSFPAAESDSS